MCSQKNLALDTVGIHFIFITNHKEKRLPEEWFLSLWTRDSFNTEIILKWLLRRICWTEKEGRCFHSLSCSLNSLQHPAMVTCPWQRKLCFLWIQREAEKGIYLFIMQHAAHSVSSLYSLSYLIHRFYSSWNCSLTKHPVNTESIFLVFGSSLLQGALFDKRCKRQNEWGYLLKYLVTSLVVSWIQARQDYELVNYDSLLNSGSLLKVGSLKMALCWIIAWIFQPPKLNLRWLAQINLTLYK